ncbi:MAG: hypothetical protein AAB260_00720 [Planctomycetota bacterium]
MWTRTRLGTLCFKRLTASGAITRLFYLFLVGASYQSVTCTWLVRAVSVRTLEYDLGEIFLTLCIVAVILTHPAELKQLRLIIALTTLYADKTRFLASPAVGEIHVGVLLPLVFLPVPYVLLIFAVRELAHQLAGIAPELLKDLNWLAGLAFCRG